MIRIPMLLALSLALAAASAATVDLPTMTAAGVVQVGDPLRLHRAYAKSANGQPVTLGYIGGSITAGTGATSGNGWADLVSAWWRSTWPASTVTHRNAAIGATGSIYGTFRVQQDLLNPPPDVVFVEFSFNDTDSTLYVETMEGLIRQILAAPGAPAVVMLCQCDASQTTAQEGHAAVAARYGIPVVSFRDAVAPQVQLGNLAWLDLLPDTIHPNNLGHSVSAALVTHVLGLHRASFLANPQAGTPPALPAPYRSDIYATTRSWNAGSLAPQSMSGWTASGGSWVSSTPGSELVFQVSGERLAIDYWKIHGAQGQVEVTVDAQPPVTFDTFYELTWGGLWRIDDLAGVLTPGPHTVRIRVKNERNPASTGYQVEIRAIRSAGSVNRTPQVQAGSDTSVILPATCLLAGSASDDGLPVGSTLATTWSTVSGPGTVGFASLAAPSTTATFAAAGTYVLRLSASDGAAIASDDVQVTVYPPGTIRSATPVISLTGGLSTPTPVLTGSAGANATVRISDGSLLIGTVVADGTGAWTWTPGSPLAPGSHSLSATAQTIGLPPSTPSPAVIVAISAGSAVAPGATTGGGTACGLGAHHGGLGLALLGLARSIRLRRRPARNDDA